MKPFHYIAFIKQIFVTGLLLLTISNPSVAADIAGTVELVEGSVWIQGADNKIRAIDKDQPLYTGDTIITGNDGELQARMQDEAIIAVRASSKLKIESYRAEGDEDDNAVFSLIVGTFRSITGWIGKYNRKNYAIKTTAATIGVRGTDHEPMYIPPPVPGMKPLGEPGVYDKVNSGRIVMKNKFGESEFGKGQAGFIGINAKRTAIKLDKVPEFFKASRNEKRIADVKQRQYKQLDKGLMERQRRLQQMQRQNPAGKPAPKLLDMRPQRGGFAPMPEKGEALPERKPPEDAQIKKRAPLEPMIRPQTPAQPRELKPQQLPPIQPRMISPPPALKPDQSMLQKTRPTISPALKPASLPDKTSEDKPEDSKTSLPAIKPIDVKEIEPVRTSPTLSPTQTIQPKQLEPAPQPVLTRPTLTK